MISNEAVIWVNKDPLNPQIYWTVQSSKKIKFSLIDLTLFQYVLCAIWGHEPQNKIGEDKVYYYDVFIRYFKHTYL